MGHHWPMPLSPPGRFSAILKMVMKVPKITKIKPFVWININKYFTLCWRQSILFIKYTHRHTRKIILSSIYTFNFKKNFQNWLTNEILKKNNIYFLDIYLIFYIYLWFTTNKIKIFLLKIQNNAKFKVFQLKNIKV